MRLLRPLAHRAAGYRTIRTPTTSLLRLPPSPSTPISRRAASSSSSSFQTGPSPPRLPAAEQAEFERLQREASTPLSTTASAPDTRTTPIDQPNVVLTAEAVGEGTSLPIRRGAPPEFEGDTNPKTGEVGGPKNEPLRWGAEGDYSFNGRVTDF